MSNTAWPHSIHFISRWGSLFLLATSSCDGGGFTTAAGGEGGAASGGSSSGGAATGGQTSSGGGTFSGGVGGETNWGGASSTGGEGSGGAPVEPVYVTCGGVECPVHEGGRCCYESATDKFVCQSAGASCDTTGSGPYVPRYPFVCDGSADCPVGQVCCYSGSSITPTGSASCQETCPPPVGGPRFQICDVNQVAPSDCLSGTCDVHSGTVPIKGMTYCN